MIFSSDTIGLYIHIPFCSSKCLYCNFYSLAGRFSEEIQKKYLDSIINELRLRISQFSKEKIIDTVYIGGGSPSYISYKLYSDFFEKLFNFVDRDNIKEFTIELNPSDIDNNIILSLSSIKNIRLSLGIQSLDERILKIINRRTSKEKVINALDIIYKHNIKKLSLDFISSLPMSNINSSKESIEFLLKRYNNINHVSLYYLELEDREALIKRWRDILPSENDEIEEYTNASILLKNYGFERYEISSFARDIENRSKHNIHYWSLDDYIGLGSGAFGCVDNVRYRNTTNINKYIDNIGIGNIEYESIEVLSLSEREREFIFLSLRQKSGIDILKYNSIFYKNFFDTYSNIIEKNMNSLNITEKSISIKEECINFTDEISLLFF